MKSTMFWRLASTTTRKLVLPGRVTTILGLSAILLSFGPAAMGQSGATTLSGESLRTVEDRSIEDYQNSLFDPNGIRSYELRRQRPENIEIIPGVSIPADSVDTNEDDSENALPPTERGDKSGGGFKLRLGSF